eukprot:symbB.v1.2.018444.t1/scaffold1473.1/size116783/3
MEFVVALQLAAQALEEFWPEEREVAEKTVNGWWQILKNLTNAPDAVADEEPASPDVAEAEAPAAPRHEMSSSTEMPMPTELLSPTSIGDEDFEDETSVPTELGVTEAPVFPPLQGERPSSPTEVMEDQLTVEAPTMLHPLPEAHISVEFREAPAAEDVAEAAAPTEQAATDEMQAEVAIQADEDEHQVDPFEEEDEEESVEIHGEVGTAKSLDAEMAARFEARETLIQAAQSGALLAALRAATAKAKAAPVEEDAKPADVESLRRKARDTLLKAARDGRLASAFKEMRQAAPVEEDAKPAHVESLRREARDTLLKAARDGRLASAFKEMRQAGLKARDTLRKAARDGRLASAFKEMRQEMLVPTDMPSRPEEGDLDDPEEATVQPVLQVRTAFAEDEFEEAYADAIMSGIRFIQRNVDPVLRNWTAPIDGEPLCFPWSPRPIFHLVAEEPDAVPDEELPGIELSDLKDRVKNAMISKLNDGSLDQAVETAAQAAGAQHFSDIPPLVPFMEDEEADQEVGYWSLFSVQPQAMLINRPFSCTNYCGCCR